MCTALSAKTQSFLGSSAASSFFDTSRQLLLVQEPPEGKYNYYDTLSSRYSELLISNFLAVAVSTAAQELISSKQNEVITASAIAFAFACPYLVLLFRRSCGLLRRKGCRGCCPPDAPVTEARSSRTSSCSSLRLFIGALDTNCSRALRRIDLTGSRDISFMTADLKNGAMMLFPLLALQPSLWHHDNAGRLTAKSTALGGTVTLAAIGVVLALSGTLIVQVGVLVSCLFCEGFSSFCLVCSSRRPTHSWYELCSLCSLQTHSTCQRGRNTSYARTRLCLA